MIYLMRHGQDDGSRLGGWSDAALSPEGLEQAENAAGIIAAGEYDIRHIFTSDLPRAKQTAQIVATRLGMGVQSLPEFREINNGAMAGMDKEQAKLRYPGIYYSTLEFEQNYPNGESPGMFFRRIAAAWKQFKANIEQLEGSILLVTHGGVINIILCIENGVEYTNRQVAYHVGHAEVIAL